MHHQSAFEESVVKGGFERIGLGARAAMTDESSEGEFHPSAITLLAFYGSCVFACSWPN
jgi:hypothetical protein